MESGQTGGWAGTGKQLVDDCHGPGSRCRHLEEGLELCFKTMTCGVFYGNGQYNTYPRLEVLAVAHLTSNPVPLGTKSVNL